MRKKVLITVVCLVLALIFTGCGKDSKDTKDAKDQAKKDGKVQTDKVIGQVNDPHNLQFQPGYSPFTGKNVAEIKLQRPVMVMIENSPAARPQAGLDSASIVYEFLAEGGITRFIALFYDNFPERIGPVRSTRPYFVETADEYQALLLHVGGSTDAFRTLKATGVEHIDEMRFGKYFWRDGKRKAPHNAYTGYTRMLKIFEKKFDYKFSMPFTFAGAGEQKTPVVGQVTGTQGDKANTSNAGTTNIKNAITNSATTNSATTSKTTTGTTTVTTNQPLVANAKEIKIPYLHGYYVTYRYDAKSGQYIRNINGNLHLMEGGKTISADNIFVRYVDTKVKDDVGRLDMTITGSGKALFIKDGLVYTGKWEKKAGEATRFLDQSGEEWKLKPGKTWIQVVPLDSKVTYF